MVQSRVRAAVSNLSSSCRGQYDCDGTKVTTRIGLITIRTCSGSSSVSHDSPLVRFSKGFDMGDCFVKKMFETPFGFASAIKVHSRNKFLSELDASQGRWVAGIDNRFRQNGFITDRKSTRLN